MRGCASLLLLLLVLLCVHFACISCSLESSESKMELEAEVQKLRAEAAGQPSNALLQIQLATALHKLNHVNPDGGRRIAEAAAAYRTALQALAGDSARDQLALRVHLQGNLGALLLSGDMAEAAIIEFKAALQTAEHHGLPLTDQGGILFNLGKALTTVGRFEAANEVYATTAIQAYGHDISSYSKALAAMQTLDAETAASAAWVAAAARGHVRTLAGFKFLKYMKLKDASAKKNSGQDKTDRDWIRAGDAQDLVWLHFALHKYYHQARKHDLAWQYLEVGNRVMAAVTKYDPAVDLNNLHHVKAIFRAPFLSGYLEDDTPIFVVGMPRSGSTLVEQMFASHSQVWAAGEDTALAPLTTDVNRQLSKPNIDHSKVCNQLGRRYISLMRARVPPAALQTEQQPHKQQPSPADHDSALPGAADHLSSHSSGNSGPQKIVDKMLRNLWLVGYIQMLVPAACIVHVVRHPLDVALSCYAQPFGYSAATLGWAWDLDDIASQIEMTWELADHWEQELPGRIHTVLYEDLVANPKAVARDLLAACGLDWEPAVLDFQQTDRPVQTASVVQVRQPLYHSAVSRWKVYEKQLAGLQQRLAPLIAKHEKLLQHHMQQHGAVDEATSALNRTPDGHDGSGRTGAAGNMKDEL